jgi:malate/lactate dehydrogenase
MVLRDERHAVPIASHQRELGVTLSLPSIVGCTGVVKVLQPDLSPEERKALQRSAENLRVGVAEGQQLTQSVFGDHFEESRLFPYAAS